MFIGATILIFIFNKFIAQHDLKNIENIQLAIERNLDHRSKDITFQDPVTREPIKTPVFARHGANADLIALLYNLDPKGDLKLAIHGQHAQLKTKALIRIVVALVIAVICVALIIVFIDYLATNWGWFLFFAMLTVVACFYIILYNFYVWRTAEALKNLKTAENSRTIKKFGRLADETVSSEEESSEDESDSSHEHEDEETQPIVVTEKIVITETIIKKEV